MTYVLLGIAGTLFAALTIRFTLARRLKRIPSPVLGVLELAGDSGRALAGDDLAALAPLFGQVRRSEATLPVPVCDVLLLYCMITSQGQIRGSRQSLRDMIRDAGASVVIVALEHPVESYIAGAPVLPFGRTNLIMTLKRKDPAFSRFLVALFSEMKKGTPLPLAWNAVAGPGVAADRTMPDTIFSNEIGPIAFC
jgi:hypothetical protein